MWRDDALVLDIMIAATDARSFVQDIDWDGFEKSRLHQNAVIRSIAIIGEAAGKLSSPFKTAHAAIPWHDIISMRHKLIHAYGDVRLDVVRDVVQNRLPPLMATLQPLIPPDS